MECDREAATSHSKSLVPRTGQATAQASEAWRNVRDMNRVRFADVLAVGVTMAQGSGPPRVQITMPQTMPSMAIMRF